MANGNGYYNRLNEYNQSREYYNQSRQPLSVSAYNPSNYFRSKAQDEEIPEPKGCSYKADKYLETFDPKKATGMKNQSQTQDFYNTPAGNNLQPTPRQASHTFLSANKDSYFDPETRDKEINSQQVVIAHPINAYNGSDNNSNIPKLPEVLIPKDELDKKISKTIDEIESEHEILKKSLEEKEASMIRHTLLTPCTPLSPLSQDSTLNGTHDSTNSGKDEISAEDSQEVEIPPKPKGRRRNFKSKNEFVEQETPPRFMNRPPFPYQFPIPPSPFPMAGMHPLQQMYAMHSALQPNQSFNIPNNFAPPRSFTATRTMSYYNVPNSMQSIPDPMPSMPNSMQSMPNSMQSLPNSMQSMPNSIQSMPNSMLSMPNSMQSTFPNAIHPPMNCMNNFQPFQSIPGQQQNFYQYPIPNFAMNYPDMNCVPCRPNHLAGGQYSQQMNCTPGQYNKENTIPLPDDVYSCQIRTKHFIAQYKNGEYVIEPEQGQPNGTANYSEH
ncbi:bromodomain-containing protein 4-like isoform X2 [Diabrotica virgifera virgifera]|nr:bromodomain-containing protein 4-like isoform X2 [Diabrotica virgifera virgifera]